MRTSPGLLLRRALIGCSAPATFRAPGGPASAEPPTDTAPAAKAPAPTFTRRHQALQHGGVVRAANSSISCRSSTKSALRHGPARTAGATRGTAPTCRAEVRHLPGIVRGRVGLVAYNGDRGRRGDSLSVSTGRGAPTVLSGSDVLELGKGIRRGGDQLAFRIVSQRDAARVGALFAAVDAKQ
ncbi:hypothetical protein [Streptomyces sp. NPDC091209]|uniref:hypothetical protein n=1 Tax=Streptomyces sp. NPDC091209 TaxID=3365974 RepID=UPI00381FB7B1